MADLLANLKAAEAAYKANPKNKAALAALQGAQKAVAAAGIDPKKPNATLTPEQQKTKSINDLLGPGVEGASALSEKLFGEGSLGRLGYMGQEGRGITDMYKNIAQSYISGQPSQPMQDVLSRYKSSLAGYSAPEVQGQREQAQRQIDAQYQTEASALKRAQAQSGVRGAAGTAQMMNLNRSRIGQQGQLEQDLFVKNADEMQRRLGEYGSALSNVENQTYARQQDALGKYRDQYAGVRADDVATKGYNDQKVADEMAGRYGALFGGLNLNLQNRGQAEDFVLNNEYLNIAKKKYGSSGAKRSSSSSSTQTANPFYQDAINLIRNS